MATEAEPSGQLLAQNTENFSNSEPSEGTATPATKPAALKNCELCNVILTSQSIVDAHMASKKHNRKVQAAESMKSAAGEKKVANPLSPLYRCDVCNVTLNSFQQKEFHMAGIKHTNKVKKNAEANEGLQGKETTSIPNNPIKMKEAVPAPSTRSADEGLTTGTEPSVPVQPVDLKCTVCNIAVNSAQQLTQHLGSKKHQLKENSLKRSTPYSRRGGPGRGASGAPGGRGRGRWGGGLKPGGVSSLKSNFQSAEFTSNFQSSGGNQSLKRDRSPRNNTPFGNGNNDFSYNSYPQGGKIPRGPQSAPFNSQDSMNHNSFRSGNNSFDGGNRSFWGGNGSFGSGNNSFGVDSSSLVDNSKSFGVANSFEGGNRSFASGNNLFGDGNSSFGGGNSSYGAGNSSYGAGSKSFAGGNSSFGARENSFGSGNDFGDFNHSFRGGFGRGSERGGGGPARRGNSLKRGRGFGPRGAFHNITRESAY